MDTNLISSYNSWLHDQLDWKNLSSSFQEIPFFHSNKTIFKSSPQFLEKTHCELEFQRIDTIFRDFSIFQDILKEITYYLSSDLSLEELLKRVEKTQVLDPKEYFSLAKISHSFFKLHKNLKRHLVLEEFVFEDKERQVFQNLFIKPCLSLFNETGEILYDKHPGLRDFWKAFKQKEAEILTRIDFILSQWQKKDLLRIENWDYIYGKYVLAVSSTSYSPKLGNIVYRSQTGQTFYIEPKEIRILNEEVSDLKYKLEVELNKILLGFSEVLQKKKFVIECTLNFTISLDRWISKIHFHSKLNLIKPVFTKDKDDLLLKDLFHPLINDPIVNTLVTQTDETRGLLISGPNTGGKSVLLKSVCLCLLLPQWGFYVPAGYAEIPFCEQIHYISNDQQQLTEGLSSFSSEATLYLNLLRKFEKAPKNCFIFIDEIFNSTSSEEASVLAFSLLEKLLSKNNYYVFLTTHHLKLKNLIFDSKLMTSAHMGFTSKENLPTYKIILGSPGQSYALEIFSTIEKRLRQNTNLTQRAQVLHDEYEIKLEEMLRELNQLKSENLVMNQKLIQKEKSLEQKEKALEGESFLKQQALKKDLLDKYQRKVEKLEKTIRDIKRSPQEFSKKQLEKTIHEHRRASDTFKAKLPTFEEISKQPIKLEEVSIGDFLFCHEVRKDLKVLAINSRKKLIQADNHGLKIWLPASKFSQQKNKQKTKKDDFIVHINKQASSQLQFKALGMRRDEFMQKAEGLCFDVLNGDIPFVDIIHGHGDGILKRALQEILKGLPELQGEFLEGNDGTTRVTLRG